MKTKHLKTNNQRKIISLSLTKIISVLLSIVIVFMTFNINTAAAKTDNIKLNKTNISLCIGKTTSLKLIKNKKKVNASFISSNRKIAKVEKKTGKVTALNKGIVKITAKYAGKKYTCKVTVKNKTDNANTSKDIFSVRIICKSSDIYQIYYSCYLNDVYYAAGGMSDLDYNELNSDSDLKLYFSKGYFEDKDDVSGFSIDFSPYGKDDVNEIGTTNKVYIPAEYGKDYTIILSGDKSSAFKAELLK